MIERDNVAMERKYYKALDDLIRYLDTDHSTAWKATDAFKATHNLFIRTTDDFDTYFPIGKSRLLLIKLAPGIRLAENRDIKPRISKTTFDEMKTALKAGQTVDEEFIEKIKEALVYKAMAWAMRRLSVQLFPEGVLQSYTGDRITLKSKQVPIKSEAEAAAQNFDKDAQSVFIEIEEIVKLNTPVDPDAEEDPDFYFDETDNFVTT